MRFALRHFKLVLLILILSIAVLLIQPLGNRFSKEQIQQFQSERQLQGIATLVLAYEEFHAGSRPSRMSELVSSKRSDLIATFYAPNDIPEHRPVGWETNNVLLDAFSDYRIAYSNIDIVAFERPHLWPDETMAVCLINLDVIRTNISGAAELLGRVQAKEGRLTP
jgi:hypothetical protein